MSKRRAFLINTALGSIGASLLSSTSKSSSESSQSEIVTCERTTKDYFGTGPFYTDHPPLIKDHLLASTTEPGQRLIISGRILNLDCGAFIPDTIIDIWHANDKGRYDNEHYNLRGYTKSNAQGFYLYETIKPGKYPNASGFRPSHIHLKITSPGFPVLTTQLYFEGDTSISTDRSASIDTGEYNATNRIIPLALNSQNKLEGQFDIIIDGKGQTVGVHDLHLSTGMIYKALPVAFNEKIDIHYGVFKSARVGLVVYNLAGDQVALLEDKSMSSGKYIATWQPEKRLEKGYYFIAIKINDLQVHYLKILKP